MWSLWLTFAASVIVGVIVSCLTAKYDTVGFILLGAWLGATSTIFLANIYARLAFAAFVLYKMWRRSITVAASVALALIILPMLYTMIFNEVRVVKLIVNRSSFGSALPP